MSFRDRHLREAFLTSTRPKEVFSTSSRQTRGVLSTSTRPKEESFQHFPAREGGSFRRLPVQEKSLFNTFPPDKGRGGVLSTSTRTREESFLNVPAQKKGLFEIYPPERRVPPTSIRPNERSLRHFSLERRVTSTSTCPRRILSRGKKPKL